MARTAVNADNTLTIKGPWSPGVRVGPFVFTSGQVPINPDTHLVEHADIRPQVRQSLTNVERIITAAGATRADVAKVTIYLRDYADFGPTNEEYEKFFDEPYPARTLITAASLPIVEGVLCRCIIEAIAYVEN